MKRAKEDQIAGKMAGAIAAYSNVLRIRPTWGPAEFNLGLVYHQQKRYQDSVPLFIRALRHDPSLESAWLFRGIGEFNLGYTRRALDSLQRFVRVRPADPQGRFFLAGVHFALEDYANAALEYIEQLRTTPDRDKVLYQLGECYLALARKQAKRLADAPDGKRYLSLIDEEGRGEKKKPAIIDIPDQKLKSATLAAIAGQKNSPGGARAYYERFRNYMDLAQIAFAELARSAPDSGLVARIEAQSLEMQSRYSEADNAYRTAITRNDKDPESFIEYGRFKARLNQHDDAVQLLTKAVALDPYNVDANSLLGEIYSMVDNPGAAIAPLRLVLSKKPNDQQSRINLAQSLIKLDQIQEAIQVLEAAPEDPDGRAHYVLSRLYRREGRAADSARALAIFEQRRNRPK